MRALVSGQPLIPGIAKLTQAFEIFRNDVQNEPDAKGDLIQHRDRLATWFETTISSLEAAAIEWKPIFDKHQADYEEQKKTLQGKQSVLDSIESLNVQLRTASQQLDAVVIEETTLRDADKHLEELRNERVIHQAELLALVGNQVVSIKEASSNLARGQLSPIPDFTEAHEAVRKVLELPLLRETRIDALVSSVLSASDIAAQWKALQDEMIALLKWKEGAPTEKGVPPITPILHAALEDGFMEKLRERISADRVSIALQAILRPRVEIFQLRDGAEIEFRKASQGEQAATLLNILMNQSNGPLIIDQPEEDLDNRIINDIIRTIRKTKDERQLILATHNANIAVNGDSENVIEMVLGERCASGAIDEPDVRDAITKTMEGGKDAFELRRKKYNF